MSYNFRMVVRDWSQMEVGQRSVRDHVRGEEVREKSGGNRGLVGYKETQLNVDKCNNQIGLY